MLNPELTIPPHDDAGESCRESGPSTGTDAAPGRSPVSMDRALHAAVAHLTGGISPVPIAAAWFDWAAHLGFSPDKQRELASSAVLGAWQNLILGWNCCCGAAMEPCEHSRAQDDRFRAPEWRSFPFNLYARSFLSVERWWEQATTDVRGVDRQHQDMTTFVSRQLLDMAAPSNFVTTNPAVLKRTLATRGMNLFKGAANWLDDVDRLRAGRPPAGMEAFKVGETVAITPGKVVHRTRLAEIIQYAPATDQVRPEPIVIVPAWIMKYYILDLSPHNSLVKFLTEQGFTVFMISWKNPGGEDRDIGFDDYRTQGLVPAIEAATALTGSRKVHAIGYCLGGTLLAVAAAAMGRDDDDRLATLTLLAAETDFTEGGELMLFVNESQISFLEDLMWETGYLAAEHMAGTFQLLRSTDLIWSRLINEYLLGERSIPIDIMAWNVDRTRMPYRMHSEYLRSLFLNNDLAEGRFKVGGRPVAIHDIHVPILAVGTEQDHVAPWQSVFKIHLLGDTDVTFVLTNGGHNAGILSEPGHVGRHFRIGTQRHGASYLDPTTWLAANPPRPGSWWPALAAWLAQRSGKPGAPPPLGKAGPFAPLYDAPGRYVFGA